MRLEIDYKEKTAKNTHIRSLKQCYQTIYDDKGNQRRNQELHEHKQKWKHNDPKSTGCRKRNSKWEVYSDIKLLYKIRKN